MEPWTTALITFAAALLVASVSAIIAVFSLRQQRRLQYIQAAFQYIGAMRHLRSVTRGCQFLDSIEQLFPKGIVDEEGPRGIEDRARMDGVILEIWFYVSDRLFALKTIKDRSMERHEEFLNEHFRTRWRTAGDVSESFRKSLLGEAEEQVLARQYFNTFLTYERRCVRAWCTDGRLQFLLAPAIHLRRRLQLAITKVDRGENGGWHDLVVILDSFLQGRGW